MFRATRISISHHYQYQYNPHHKLYTTNNSYNNPNNSNNSNKIIIVFILGLYFTLIKNK